MSRVASIIPLPQISKHTNAGAKARNLSVLQKMGHNVPVTFVIPFESFEEYLQDRDSGLQNVSKLLEGILDESKNYSVRSSANVEDSSLFSFAGQFETHLNCKGIDAVIDAVECTWVSAQGETAKAYKSGLGHRGVHLKMAVIIQEMVEPEFSGVVFTRNPITGLNEVIVETVEGYGDALVQEGVTPDRWVYKWGNWLESPENQEDRREIILEIAEKATEIGRKVNAPMDLEWAYDGDEIIWLQMREITTLRNTNIYSNRISREFLPGIILPLVWSVNIPVVNSSWKRLFVELIGSSAENIDINSLAKSFYYRAYFNMGVVGDIFETVGMPREALEILAGIEAPEQGQPTFRPGSKSMRFLPRMISVAIRKLFFSKNIEIFLRNKKKEYQEIAATDSGSLDESVTLSIIDTLFELNTDASYYVIVSQLLNSLYNMILRGQLEKRGVPFDKVKFKETDKRLLPIDPNQQISLLRDEYQSLDKERQNLLREISWSEAMKTERLNPFRDRLRSFIQRFGHLSDSGNDFSKPTWRETPDLILGMIMDQSSEVEEDSGSEVQEKLEAALADSAMLRSFYKRAVKYREYRESVNFLYTYGYGLFRRYFRRLGLLLNKKGNLEQEDDIFYLSYNEIKALVSGKSDPDELRNRIVERRTDIERYRDITLPEVIYNELPESALVKGRVLHDLHGVATSRGHYIGPTRLVYGPSDFERIQTGDVLVIPYSDVSWTPLFAKASAVVSESGGILSHCSIVAREYGIPAVVSVTGAMKIGEGVTLAVDGYRGEVQIMEE